MSPEPIAKVRVTRRFNHAPERIFDAWLDPARLGEWLFATATGEMTRVEVDARVGGGFNITERRGGEEVSHLGTYIEIDRPRRLVFDVSVPKYAQNAERVTVDIEATTEGCILTLTHESRPREDVTPDMLHTGWTMILEGLASMLQAGERKDFAAVESVPAARASRTIKATPERVFDAWLNPEFLGRWMFGPEVREEEILHLKVNPMVGGSFSFLVRRSEAELDHIGEYLELDRPRRLVFTWGIRQESATDFSVVRVDIVPEGDGCNVQVAHEMHPDWAAYADRAAAGWTHMMDALARLLE